MTVPNYPWRRVLAKWPAAWRQMWGNRANELAESGVRFPEDEKQAFAEVSAIKSGAAVAEGESGPIADPVTSVPAKKPTQTSFT